MSSRPIIDAGPSLNFLSLNKERILISILGRLSAPETIQQEVLRKSRQDGRFGAAGKVWPKLAKSDYIQILSDDPTPELEAVILRMTNLPMKQRLRSPKDLGETMVIAHAVVLAEKGETVTVLIDERRGAEVATLEIRRLNRMRARNQAVGGIVLASTLTVLEQAARLGHVRDKGAMRSLYLQLRSLDDGLPSIEQTGLLASGLWSKTP